MKGSNKLAKQPKMGRAPCCDKANVKKGPWSPEEDAKLKSFIEKHGTGGNWITLPQKMGLKRCGKSCRLRWLNYLRPNIKHGGFTEEEDDIICSLYLAIGSRWSIIASQLPGRTDNDIKNYWNTKLKKKLLGKVQRKECHQQLIHGGRNLQLLEAKEYCSNYCSLLLPGKDQSLVCHNYSNNLVVPAAAVPSNSYHQFNQIIQHAMSKLGGKPSAPSSGDEEQKLQHGSYLDCTKIDPFLELLGQLPHCADHVGLPYGRGSGIANASTSTAAANDASGSMNWDEVISSPLVQNPALSVTSSEEPAVFVHGDHLLFT